MSDPFGFKVSHISVQTTQKMQQLIIYFVHDEISAVEPHNYVIFELSADADELLRAIMVAAFQFGTRDTSYDAMLEGVSRPCWPMNR